MIDKRGRSDLVADAGAPHAAASVQQLQPTLAVAHALPRLAWQLGQLSQPAAQRSDNNARQRELASAEAGLARTLGMLNAALVHQPRPALADAGAAGAAAYLYFHLPGFARPAGQLPNCACPGAHRPPSSRCSSTPMPCATIWVCRAQR